MTPAQAAWRLGCSCLLGGGLGLFFDFLRPLHSRRPIASDGLFVLGMLWAYLWFGFALCRGDLRMGYLPGMILGALLWEWLPGRRMRGIFSFFWRWEAKMEGLLLLPGKKV